MPHESTLHFAVRRGAGGAERVMANEHGTTPEAARSVADGYSRAFPAWAGTEPVVRTAAVELRPGESVEEAAARVPVHTPPQCACGQPIDPEALIHGGESCSSCALRAKVPPRRGEVARG